MTKLRIMLVLLFSFACLLGAAHALPNGAPAPDFKAMDASGKLRSLSEFRGKVVVLNFWATWCPLCVSELATLDRIQKQYEDEGVVVLAVATDSEGWRRVMPFLARRNLGFPVVVGSAHLCQLYGGFEALPQTFFLNREGRVVASVNSALTEQTFLRVIQLMR